ncbi:hypothetical protein B9479_008191, partial [Cryptococcus floricola]
MPTTTNNNLSANNLDNTIILVLVYLAVWVVCFRVLRKPERRRIHDGYWNVERQINEWLSFRRHGIRQSLGIDAREFLVIRDYLVDIGVEMETEGVTAEARLAMALWVLRKGSSFSEAAEDLAQRADDTVWG